MIRLRTTLALLGGLSFACGGESAHGPAPSPTGAPTTMLPGPPPDEHPTGGAAVNVAPSPAYSTELATIRQELGEVSALDAAGFASRYAVTHGTALGYDPTTAAGMDRIQGSSMALSQGALDVLGRNGFVVSGDAKFPTFTYGYATLYGAHLPLYVSADSVLNAVHRSYDNILEQMELQVITGELRKLLDGLRSRLVAANGISADAKKDVDVYLAVALGLLTEAPASPVAGGSSGDIAALTSGANAGTGSKDISLFGVSRTVDFSQFTPRGHYTDDPRLKAYFRAMMWLGRIDFRLIETQEDGSQLFYRRQFDAMLALHSLFDAENSARQQAIDSAIQAFVGESDNMKVGDVAALLGALGAPPDATTVNAPDEQVAQAILDGGFGAQRISSDIMINGVGMVTLPLNRTFLVFGQRYTVDSHVFSNVVYDRVHAMRLMPNPLDVAFAALHNDQAGELLAPELQRYPYAPDLASMRVLVDGHDDDFWGANLYNLWLSSLRALSPSADTAEPAAAGLPLVTGTEAWGRRILNAQLASWSELRHDTILYVKQSYTSGVSCEFPDAYVDPYPGVFSALARFADYAQSHIVPIADRGAPSFKQTVADYFTHLGTVMTMLGQMAEYERAGTPFTAEQMAFINDAVTVEQICGGAMANGWYPRLVYGNPTDFDPTIADVHTQPTDEAGNDVGRVLHVGTGYARLMVVTTNTCTGPRAYAGLTSSYYERVTEQYDRLTDERWKDEFQVQTEPADVPWVSDLVARTGR